MNNCKFMQNLNFFKNLGFDTDKFVEVEHQCFLWDDKIKKIPTNEYIRKYLHKVKNLPTFCIKKEEITDELIERLNTKKIIAFKPIESTTEIYYTIIE